MRGGNTLVHATMRATLDRVQKANRAQYMQVQTPGGVVTMKKNETQKKSSPPPQPPDAFAPDLKHIVPAKAGSALFLRQGD